MRFNFAMSQSRDDLSYRIIGCAIAVHKELGPGLVESVYEECLEAGMTECGLMVSRQPSVKVVYDGTLLDRNFRPDFIVGGLIVVEIKSVQTILPVHLAQGLTYLRLTGLELGLIINFNTPQLIKGIRRLILSNQPPVVP